MVLKWNPEEVQKSLDRIEAELKKIEAPIQEALAITDEITRIPYLPKYVEGEVSSLRWQLKEVPGRFKAHLQRSRELLPQNAEVKIKAKPAAKPMW